MGRAFLFLWEKEGYFLNYGCETNRHGLYLTLGIFLQKKEGRSWMY